MSFNPDTENMRYAPSLDILADLQSRGARLKVFDPHAMPKARSLLKGVTFCADAYAVCRDSDCLVILTEWKEFKELDPKKVKRLSDQPIVVDGRNIYDPKKMKALGFRYYSMGRPS